jgi:acetyl esterase/lipase
MQQFQNMCCLTQRPVVLLSILMTVFLSRATGLEAREPDHVINLWSEKPPGPSLQVDDEQDFTKPEDNLVAGKRIIKLGNVKTPQIHVFLPDSSQRSEAAMVICPGGGYNILAWDLEGTEVADWLNSLGITAIVLKYRVPTRQQDPKWMAPVQDAQRAISLARHHAAEWKIDSKKVGILGFSAGGEAAARTALAPVRHYERTDEADDVSCRPDNAVLIYPAYLVNDAKTGLREDVAVTKDAPPMFLAHAFDDPVVPESSVYLFLALKTAGVPSELHVYDTGGHGYGLRSMDSLPVTGWTGRCADWMKRNGWSL